MDLHLVQRKQAQVGQLLEADQGGSQPGRLVVMGPQVEPQLAQGFPII